MDMSEIFNKYKLLSSEQRMDLLKSMPFPERSENWGFLAKNGIEVYRSTPDKLDIVIFGSDVKDENMLMWAIVLHRAWCYCLADFGLIAQCEYSQVRDDGEFSIYDNFESFSDYLQIKLFHPDMDEKSLGQLLRKIYYGKSPWPTCWIKGYDKLTVG
jgi:hypothetical protein